MNNLPYFFLLLKKNIGLWTLIATGSFSKIDTAHIEHFWMSPYYLILKNYSLSQSDTFNEISLLSAHGGISIDFRTSNPKYLDSIKYYFGTSSISGSMEGGYTLNDSTIHNSTDMLGPIDIGIGKKVSVFLGRSGEHEYKIDLLLHSKDEFALRRKLEDSLNKADSAQYGLRGRAAPYIKRLVDSALYLGMGGDHRLTGEEQKQLAGRRIDILNKAIRADSTYADAYELKFGDEVFLQRYSDILITGKKILKIVVDKPEIVYQIGIAYELTDHVDSAKAYYKQALLLYDQQMSQLGKNGEYDQYLLSKKALVLILLNREQEGRAIFKELSETPTMNKLMRKMYEQYLSTTRDEFLHKMDL